MTGTLRAAAPYDGKRARQQSRVTVRMVTLRDGRQVPSDSEEWRHECEARTICRMPTRAERRESLERIERLRGTAARLAVQAEVTAIWEAEFRPKLSARGARVGSDVLR